MTAPPSSHYFLPKADEWNHRCVLGARRTRVRVPSGPQKGYMNPYIHVNIFVYKIWPQRKCRSGFPMNLSRNWTAGLRTASSRPAVRLSRPSLLCTTNESAPGSSIRPSRREARKQERIRGLLFHLRTSFELQGPAAPKGSKISEKTPTFYWEKNPGVR